jgi:hypothetical protein
LEYNRGKFMANFTQEQLEYRRWLDSLPHIIKTDKDEITSLEAVWQKNKC